MIASGALFPIGTHKFAKGGNQNYNKNVKYHKDFLDRYINRLICIDTVGK